MIIGLSDRSRRMAVAIRLRGARGTSRDGRSALRTQRVRGVPNIEAGFASDKERDDHMRSFSFGPPQHRARVQRVIGVLRKGPASPTPKGMEPAKDQLPETNPKGGGQAHPSNRSPRFAWSGDEPFQRGTSDQAIPASPPDDPSGSVFSSLVQEPADIRPDGQSCKLLLSSWIQISLGTIRSAKRRLKEWWSLSGSNRRPPACKAGALPAELKPQYGGPG